jgi:outer membrane protein assembly factor BamD (BamD/ComL family)
MKDKKIISVLLGITVFCVFVSGCKKKIPQPRDPAVIYNEGIAMMSSSGKHTFLNPPDYEKARKAFQEILYDHPTSEYAPLAELKIADHTTKKATTTLPQQPTTHGENIT